MGKSKEEGGQGGMWEGATSMLPRQISSQTEQTLPSTRSKTLSRPESVQVCKSARPVRFDCALLGGGGVVGVEQHQRFIYYLSTSSLKPQYIHTVLYST